jgi:hypothetical protein
MSYEEENDDQLVGHDSTTIPGGEKDLESGDPGRTPGKAEGGEEEAEE